MDTPNKDTSTRIRVGKVWFSWQATIALYLCIVFACGFLGIAVMSSNLLWWLAVCLTVWVTWLLTSGQRRDQRDWNRVASIEVREARIAFLPSQRMHQIAGDVGVEAPFPVGSRLECHIDTADLYVAGDNGMVLQRSLWVAHLDGTKQQLVGRTTELNLTRMTSNLSDSGIPFRVVKIYDGMEGEHTETDVTGDYTSTSGKTWKQGLVALLVGTSSLWLGLAAGILVHKVAPAIAIGVAGCVFVGVVRMRTSMSKRSALIQVATILPSYAAGYAFAVIAVWYIFKR
jgi:hypothetical protein